MVFMMVVYIACGIVSLMLVGSTFDAALKEHLISGYNKPNQAIKDAVTKQAESVGDKMIEYSRSVRHESPAYYWSVLCLNVALWPITTPINLYSATHCVGVYIDTVEGKDLY